MRARRAAYRGDDLRAYIAQMLAEKILAAILAPIPIPRPSTTSTSGLKDLIAARTLFSGGKNCG
jgi:hypothetical protein